MTPSTPDPSAPGEALTLDVMAERLKDWLAHSQGVYLSVATARSHIAYAFTGLSPGLDRDAAVSAMLDRLSSGSPAEQDDGWRTIESAPRNVSILVFVPNVEHYGPGIYRAIHVDMGTRPHWLGTAWAIGRDFGPESQPTHWRPLPPAPLARSGAEEES